MKDKELTVSFRKTRESAHVKSQPGFPSPPRKPYQAPDVVRLGKVAVVTNKTIFTS